MYTILDINLFIGVKYLGITDLHDYVSVITKECVKLWK